MIKRIFCVFLLIITTYTLLFGDEDKTIKVRTQGLGFIISGDMALARETSLHDARRRALEEALGTFIESESVVENYQLLEEKIYSRTQGFLKNEKIINEEHNDEIYRITIEIEVGVSNLEKDIEGINLTLKRKQWPRVMIMVKESVLGEIFDPWKNKNPGICETVITNKLKEKNFIIIERGSIGDKFKNIENKENDLELIKELGQNAQVEILILGTAQSSSAGNILNTMMKSLQAEITCKAIKPDTLETLTTAVGSASKPHINQMTGATQALQEASSRLSEELSAKIIEKLNQELSSTSRVTLVLNGVEYNDLQKIINILKIQVVSTLSQEIIQRSFENNVAILEAEVKGNTKNLADELSIKKFPLYSFKIKSISSNKLEIAVEKISK
ncbi:MAG: hypothetical protein HY934_03030 [Candidatus Firestonebacteria bacterium]|nr:hypothetical protein [Candidatus Firestonebacteria bacterium]